MTTADGEWRLTAELPPTTPSAQRIDRRARRHPVRRGWRRVGQDVVAGRAGPRPRRPRRRADARDRRHHVHRQGGRRAARPGAAAVRGLAAAGPTRRRAERAAAALLELDGAAVCTLHAFAQRLLTEHPLAAGLPPRVEVADEVASQLAFDERWAAFVDELLDDERLQAEPDDEDGPGPAARRGPPARGPPRRGARPSTRLGPRGRARRRPAAAAASRRLDVGELVVELIDLAGLAAARRSATTCSPASSTDSPKPAPVRWPTPTRCATRCRRCSMPSAAPTSAGRATRPNWARAAYGRRPRPAAATGATHVPPGAATRRLEAIEACLRRLVDPAGRRPRSAAAELRRAEGRLAFHDLLVLARELLRDAERGPAARAALHQRYTRLLLDEFQDTDPIQVEIATLLAAPPVGAAPVRGRRSSPSPAACSSSATRSSRSTGSAGPTSPRSSPLATPSPTARSPSPPTSAPPHRSWPG